jgi:hypothetical protein
MFSDDRPMIVAADPLVFKVFVSSFAGDGLDVNAMKQAAANQSPGMGVLFMPNFHPSQSNFQSSGIDGALNWMAWPNNGNNKAPDASGNVSVLQGDQSYMSALAGKAYIAREYLNFVTSFCNVLTNCIRHRSRFRLVLDALWPRSLLQQELGVPW